MIRRIVLLILAASMAMVFYYISRFWPFRWWDREGLFGIEALRPQGGLLARWLRGTEAAPYELMIWLIAVFLTLSIAQKLVDWVWPAPKSL